MKRRPSRHAARVNQLTRLQLNGRWKDGIAARMLARYVVQRDLDGTWSVRETATNNPASLRGTALVGLSEKMAANHAKKLNNRLSEVDEKHAEPAARELQVH
jgi:hypothetical protein